MKTKDCVSCQNLPGCELVVDVSGDADVNKFLVGGSETCNRWAAAGGHTVFKRQIHLAMFGSAALRAIHIMKPKENEEEDLEVDFLAMVKDGITFTARRDQLRYITNKDGSEFILDKRGEKKLRGIFPLCKYATDPNGPVKTTVENIAFMSNPNLVKLILEAEKEAGIVISANEAKKQKKADVEVPAQPTEVKKMGKISIRKSNVQLPAKAGGTKVTKPATNKKVDTGNGEDGAAATAETAGTVDEAVASVIEAAIGEIRKDLTEQTKAFKKDLKGMVTTMEATVAEMRSTMSKQHTVQHDVLLQHLYSVIGMLNEEVANTNMDELQLLPQGYDIDAYDTNSEEADQGEA